MPRPARPLPDTLDESFGTRGAILLGVSPGRLRGRDLERPFRGVRMDPGRVMEAAAQEGIAFSADELRERQVRRRARAYRHVMPDGAFYAGRTAGVLQKLPVEHSRGSDDSLCVAVFAPQRPLRAEGIRGMKVSARHASVQERDGLRMSSPASTWAMLAGELTLRELIVVGDAIVRVPRNSSGMRQPGSRLATLEQLRRAADAPWRRGRVKLDEALEHIREGCMSPLETDFRLDAVAAGLPEPLLDVEIRDARGRLLGISDAVYPAQRTVVEVEGDHHRTSRAQWNRDIEKYAAYAAEGWEVVRLTSDHIRGQHPVAASTVRQVLLRRGWKP